MSVHIYLCLHLVYVSILPFFYQGVKLSLGLFVSMPICSYQSVHMYLWVSHTIRMYVYISFFTYFFFLSLSLFYIYIYIYIYISSDFSYVCSYICIYIFQSSPLSFSLSLSLPIHPLILYASLFITIHHTFFSMLPYIYHSIYLLNLLYSIGFFVTISYFKCSDKFSISLFFPTYFVLLFHQSNLVFLCIFIFKTVLISFLLLYFYKILLT